MSNRENEGSWAGVILVAILTVSAFVLVVALSKVVDLDSIGKNLELPHLMSQEKPEEPVVTEGDSIAGSYSATSAVYNGMELNGMMLKVSGYTIAFDVREDGSFTANLNDDTYEGNWYRDGSYVEFQAGGMSMTGEYADGVISIADESQGIAVVLEK